MLDIVNIDTSKVNFKVKFSVLSENEQQLILGEIPQETTPIEIKESEPKSTPIKKRGKLKAKSLSNSNISSGLGIPSEDYKEGSTSIEMSDYSFDKLKDILSEEEYKALDERLRKLFDTGLTKEYWDKLPIKLKERNIQCVKG